MDIEVLIAGAGPTGLVLAIELARRGVGVRIVDSAPAFPAASRGDALAPRTLEIFEDLGVLDEVLALGHLKYPMRIYHDGEPAGQREMASHREPRPDKPYPNMWLLGQARTEEVLRDRLAGYGVRVELGTAVTGFQQDAEAVTVRLGGSSVRAAYLVGADGGKSFVRGALGVEFPGTTDESLRMMICDVALDGLDLGYAHWFASPAGAGVALVPVSGQPPYFQLRAPLGAGPADGSTAGVRALLDSVCCRARLREVAWSTVLRSNLRVASRFRDGRVFLAGDAAHVHPPTGSHGFNTGVEDAYNLGWKLAAALSGTTSFLDTYEQERHTAATRIRTMIIDLMCAYAGGRSPAPALDLGYHHSPLSVDERAVPGKLRAGDRAPDAPVHTRDGRAVRLFELFRGTHATLLEFGRAAVDPPPWPGEVRVHSLGPGGDFADRAGHAFRAYDVAAGTQVLVRPDGYVAHIRST